MITLQAQLPNRLYQQVEALAATEKLSIDQFVMMALSAQVSAWLTRNYLQERAKRGSWEQFQQILAKVADIEPEPHDRL